MQTDPILLRLTEKMKCGSCWLEGLTGFKLCSTTPSNTQQHAARFTNRCNLYHPTMLEVAGQINCVRLNGVSDLAKEKKNTG